MDYKGEIQKNEMGKSLDSAGGVYFKSSWAPERHLDMEDHWSFASCTLSRTTYFCKQHTFDAYKTYG